MAKMMRRRSWVKVTNTYGADYSGDFRGRDRAEFKALVDEWSDEIWEEKQIREFQDFHYSRYSRQRADRMLEGFGIPTWPVTGHHTPE